MNSFDTVIIGGGMGGLFAAYNLKLKNPSHSIVIIDQGDYLDKRNCPAKNNNIGCVHCKTCAITSGIAGSGAFSDAKFNIGTSYGGTLGEELGEEIAMNYINNVDAILKNFTHEYDYPDMFKSNDDLKLKCLQNNLRLLDMNVRHLGTDRNYYTMQNLIFWLIDNNVLFFTNQTCTTIEKLNNIYVAKTKDYEFNAKNIIVATGRGGADFVKHICNKFNIHSAANAVDIGVRVEMKDSIWKEFSSKIYEPKILYKTKTFEDRCRMFCFNQGGIVSAENNRGIITANGHSFADQNKKTDNCNFAILSSIHFTEPFDQPTEYAENISRMANMIGKGNVLVQRFGDLIRGRRTNNHRLSQNTVIPTLKATAGDISLVLPHRILTNIIETIYALDKVAPGTANDDTLLYGCESKYYSLKPDHNENFEIQNNMYLIGDGSGITRGLSQSGAMGLYVADKILSKEK